jgi:lactoylglutathione lyase
MSIHELRLVLTVKDFDRATALFRDALGLEQLAAWQNEGGHVVLLDAGHGTLEIADEAQARAIDQIEVGRRVAGPIRIAFGSSDSESAANALVGAGAKIIAGPVVTPWRDRNVRLEGPDGVQLTLFTPLGD